MHFVTVVDAVVICRFGCRISFGEELAMVKRVDGISKDVSTRRKGPENYEWAVLDTLCQPH